MKFELLKTYAEDNGFILSDKQADQFERFADMLIEKNKVMNLTAILEPREIEIKHMIDSIGAASLIKDLGGNSFSLLDVGCGAGFPGIPLKILYPENKFTLLDSSNKRINFVNEVIIALELENISAVAARAEDFKERELFDICISRAVASLNVLCEYTLPFVKVGGHCIFYKSTDIEEEIVDAKAAIIELGGSLLCVNKHELPENCGGRSHVVIRKVSETPLKYPRRAGKPAKSPIK